MFTVSQLFPPFLQIDIPCGFNFADVFIQQNYVSSNHLEANNPINLRSSSTGLPSKYGPRREKTCLGGFGQGDIQTSLLSYRD